MLNASKILFLVMLIASTLLSISSKNWIGIWMGMEMNLMSFIPILAKSKNKKSSKASMIYFLSQSIGSVLLLFFILINKFIMINPMMVEEIMKIGIIISLLIKLGAAPFHNWFPMAMNNLKWTEAMILMTWQKITPMYMLSLFMPNKFLFISIISSAMIGAIGGLNYTSLTKIMAYSSINHMSWMLIMIQCQMQWFKYLVLYSLTVLMASSFFNHFNAYFLNQINSMNNTITEKLTLSSLLLSMGGLPPFLGFLPKWMAIQSMINNNMIFVLMFLIMMSMLTLFFYMRMISPLILFYSSMSKVYFKMEPIKLMSVILFINFLLPLLTIFNF
uniref:NADH-ubiquinone oxidoreductase chain 2 n=1 Tax=Macropes robustus TaxID=2813415 RepID=A0A8T9ZX19_9HEMI|nr:NADH dehydrogenase subunit 2 [Macropes robustus]